MSRWFTILLVAGCAQVVAIRAAEPTAGSAAETTNSIGMKMVLIPAGEFLMGGQESADDLVAAFPAYHRPASFFKDEYPRHPVQITKPFRFGKYEVTVGQFRRFTDDTGYKTEAEEDGLGGWGYDSALGKCRGRDPKFNWRNPGFKQTDDQPVLDVTWNDFDEILPRRVNDDEPPLSVDLDDVSGSGADAVRFRVRYSKIGAMKFLGHHDLSRVFYRAFRRAGFKLVY